MIHLDTEHKYGLSLVNNTTRESGGDVKEWWRRQGVMKPNAIAVLHNSGTTIPNQGVIETFCSIELLPSVSKY